VHPWILPTVHELGMTSFLTLGLVDTKEDPTMDLIKKKLAGAKAIRRAVRQGQPNVEALHDQPTTIYLGAFSGGVAGGFVDDSGSHPDVDVNASHDYKHVGAQEKINTFENTLCIVSSHPLHWSLPPLQWSLSPLFTLLFSL